MIDIFVITILESIVASFYFFIKKKEVPAFKVLSIFFIFLSFPMIINLIRIVLGIENKIFFSLNHSVPFTFGAFIYIYSTFIIDNRLKFIKKDFYHFIPFICVCLLLVSGFELAPLDYHFNPHTGTIMKFEKVSWQWILIFTLVNILFITYTIAIIFKLKQHRKKLGEYFSNQSLKISLNWVKICTIVFLSLKIITNILYVVLNYIDFFNISPNMVNSYGTTVFIFIFSIFASGQPLIYKEENNEEIISTVDDDFEKKYEKSGLKKNELVEYLEKIEEYVKIEKPYLNNELTIVDFSEALNIKRHYITQILNDELGMNFNTYINKLRIDYVIEQMKDMKSPELSLLEIAMDAGFNSKSTFNRVFKSYIGRTPTEYKKNILKK